MTRHHLLAIALLAAGPAAAQTPAPASASAPSIVAGSAAAELVSRASAGEVHLVTDARLDDRRAVLKLVVLNRSGTPQPFGPDAVAITVDGQPATVAARAELLGGNGGGNVARESSQGRATASLPVNGAGQTDVSGYTGGMAGSTAGVPTDTIGRARGAGAPDAAFAAQLDAVLLKPVTIAPGRAEGGQLFSSRLRRKPRVLDVAVTFAGEVHRFRVDGVR